jgi:beta-glucanase (GH16 family)
MLRFSAFLILVLLTTSARADNPPGWNLVWADEFTGDELDRSKWDFQIGNGFFNYDSNQWISGWGNGELQYYTDSTLNTFVREGRLHIRALKESLHNCGYTSARLRTKQRDGTTLLARKYGRVEFRAKLPTGKGVWPALWMLPDTEAYGGWAASGEIDILEARGAEPRKILGTIHYGSRWPHNQHAGGEYLFPEGQSIADFHVYAIEWDPGEIRWFVDGHEYSKQNFWWSTSQTNGQQGKQPASEKELNPWPAPFDQPFHLVVNVAVGGQFGGPPDRTTPFPATMEIDYVRVYERDGGPRKLVPRGPGKLPFGK